MDNIKWGIIGCGDVTEVKSGPAFNKVPNSSLVAVMRRDAAKAEDYARRHGVPRWYDNAAALINDPEVNAVYIATPPLQHEEYTLQCIQAGKPVYVEKPMTLNTESAYRMQEAAIRHNVKLTVAHYRRAQPMFRKIKALLEEKAIGDIRFVSLQMLQPPVSPEANWRVDPAVSGGGLFHDLAPHQLDLMTWFFGRARSATGIARNQAKMYRADDLVSGNILFENGIVFNGIWCFSVGAADKADVCEITGSLGKIRFPVFGHSFTLSINGAEQVFAFDALQHVQQPMIEQVTAFFLDKGPNPCSAEEAILSMQLMDSFTKKDKMIF
ncbi:Gfo/Idh/MocA family protein [Chitinophaga eiseniae]|uniref:Gfo/Idh/MocA family oxidoreductase n=1 Tax=Chitinophaga eiseniae TaxID=634771 RepID=A0A847SBB5_9BACT|nr:Gfo/Idh/MocA family oxidoreductase [Chitinophaga eiseniae]NLR77404.1 Gfo/Idh/MocA family oxidoreductase [Chitinophaga eiseniae]